MTGEHFKTSFESLSFLEEYNIFKFEKFAGETILGKY